MRAVLERDYLAEARRPRAFFARTAIGGVAAAVLLFRSLAGWELLRDAPDRLGSEIFGLLARAAFAFVAILTPTLVVGTILAERRRHTLSLLLASPVTPVGIALGKFASRAGTVLAWTSAVLPPLVITLLFGGVSARQAANLALALLGTVLELAAWGLLVSCVFRRMATAAVFVYLLPLLHWGAATDLFGAWRPHHPGPWLALAATTPLPSVTGLATWPGAVAPASLAGPLALLVEQPGLGCLVFSLLLACGSILLSGRLLSREEELRGGGRTRRPGPALERRLRRRLTGGNPVVWKESLLLNAAGSRSLYYAVALGLLAGEAIFLVLHLEGLWTPEMNFHYAWIAATGLATLASVTGAASMTQEKSQGTLELLRISLLTPGEIAHGKVLGLAVGLGWLLLLPLGHLAVTVAAGVIHPVAGLAAAATTALFVACYLAIGVHWGTVAWAAWAALAGSVAVPALGMLGCSLVCIVPVLLVVINASRGRARIALESLALPGILAGAAYLSVGSFAGGLNDLLAGTGVSVRSPVQWLVFGAITIAFQVGVLRQRWTSLPAALRRVMARVSEGEEEGEPLRRVYRIGRPVRPPPAAGRGEEP